MQYSKVCTLKFCSKIQCVFSSGKHGKCQKKELCPIGSKRQSSTRSKEDTLYEFKKGEVH